MRVYVCVCSYFMATPCGLQSDAPLCRPEGVAEKTLGLTPSSAVSALCTPFPLPAPPLPPPSPTPRHSALQPRGSGHKDARADVVKVLRVLQMRHVAEVERVALVENLVLGSVNRCGNLVLGSVDKYGKCGSRGGR